MQAQYLLRALLAITITPVVHAGVIPRQDSGNDTVPIQEIFFNILSHAGKNDTDSNGLGPYPPWIAYSQTVSYDGKWAECYTEIDYPMNATTGDECEGAMNMVSLPLSGCPPAGGDSVNELNNVTWSVTRYGDRYVQQVNVPDQDDMSKIYVACAEFSQSDFQCYPTYDQVYNNGGPDGVFNLTATVGQVCPTY